MASLLQLRIVRCNVCICMFARVRFTKQKLSKQATETATALVVQAKTSLETFYNTENLLDVWIWSSKSVTNVPLSPYIKAANQIMRNMFIYKAEYSWCFQTLFLVRYAPLNKTSPVTILLVVPHYYENLFCSCVIIYSFIMPVLSLTVSAVW